VSEFCGHSYTYITILTTGKISM